MRSCGSTPGSTTTVPNGGLYEIPWSSFEPDALDNDYANVEAAAILRRVNVAIRACVIRPPRVAALIAMTVFALVTSVSAVGASATRRVVVPGSTASLSIPADWKVLTITHLLAMSKADFAQFSKENPQLAKVAGSMSQTSPLKLYAVKPQLKSVYETALSINVGVAAELTLADLRAAVVGDVKRLPDSRGLQVTIVSLPAGHALKASWNVPFSVGGLHQRIATVEYGFAEGGRVYFFQYTTGLPIFRDLTPVFERSAKSIRFARTHG